VSWGVPFAGVRLRFARRAPPFDDGSRREYRGVFYFDCLELVFFAHEHLLDALLIGASLYPRSPDREQLARARCERREYGE